jgi:hypothetical protein
MTFLTLFSAPKPFADPHIATIQRNAIQTWLRLPDVEVILLGEEDGLAQVAAEFGVKHLPDVARNASGTPLISSMFALARQHSDSPLLGIVNTDILLLPDLVDSARRVAAQRERFVLLGRRWDLDVRDPIDFANGWQFGLRERVRKQGQLHRPAGSDYFVFPRECYTDIPDFAIGRAGWDNWMIYKAHRAGWPVVEATHDVIIVHQQHDYHHLPGGVPHYTLPETDENIRLAGGHGNIRYTVLDADTRLVDGYLTRPRWSTARLVRGLEVFLRKVFAFLPERTLETVARPKRWAKRVRKFIKQ